MVATSCDLNVPRCTTKGQQVRLHGSREVSSLITEPPGTPVIPCCNKIYHIWNWAASEVLRLFRRSTHTHPALGRVVSLQMRWRRGWRGNEDDMKVKMKWKITQPGHEEGNAKEEGGGKHRHQHTWPGAGKPWKGKGKEKRRPTDTEKDQRRGEGRKCLNQPTTAKPTPT